MSQLNYLGPIWDMKVLLDASFKCPVLYSLRSELHALVTISNG